ncbi:ubiquinol-cytochrome c reductase iron-sulfur subunit [Amphibiibacter pelophylacis]|uniref:Ubiquinol-cytochrome c reductase iron-sulfur subunit n=1 Tax=Amphibiibacter pelophylacis TaxID=1799477 RepID=A0ACC6P486_9BURK
MKPATPPPPTDPARRRWMALSCGLGAVGGVAATIPLAGSLLPPEHLRHPPPLRVDLAALAPGQKLSLTWLGQPLWVVHRTPQQVAALSNPALLARLADPQSQRPGSITPTGARNATRSLLPQWLVVVGVCTHLGCTPLDRLTPGAGTGLPPDWPGGFLCPCHGSTFDLAGRVFRDQPAPDNLAVPAHRFASATELILGEDTPAQAA